MSKLRSTFFSLAVFALGTLLPHAAAACAVCTSGTNGGTKRAFVTGSLLLSTLPPFTIGGVALYVRRRAKQEAAKVAAREALRGVASTAAGHARA